MSEKCYRAVDLARDEALQKEVASLLLGAQGLETEHHLSMDEQAKIDLNERNLETGKMLRARKAEWDGMEMGSF